MIPDGMEILGQELRGIGSMLHVSVVASIEREELLKEEAYNQSVQATAKSRRA